VLRGLVISWRICGRNEFSAGVILVELTHVVAARRTRRPREFGRSPRCRGCSETDKLVTDAKHPSRANTCE
jgi:hypothetical protein